MSIASNRHAARSKSPPPRPIAARQLSVLYCSNSAWYALQLLGSPFVFVVAQVRSGLQCLQQVSERIPKLDLLPLTCSQETIHLIVMSLRWYFSHTTPYFSYHISSLNRKFSGIVRITKLVTSRISFGVLHLYKTNMFIARFTRMKVHLYDLITNKVNRIESDRFLLTWSNSCTQS